MRTLTFIRFFFGAVIFLWNSTIYAQNSPFISTIFEYCPAPGQFINTVYGGPAAAQSLVGTTKGIVSLGSAGGYLIGGFDHTITNHPDNPYGIDFTVFGNANAYSSEPAAVYVMKDENQNHLPDDTWYLLAGSDSYFSTSVKDYEITYQNPGSNAASDIPWADNQGNDGFLLANSFHLQPYYPLDDSFPNINNIQYTLKGLKIEARVDSSNTSFIITQKLPFGFADNTPRNLSYQGWEPDNPYTPEVEGTGGDGFDISWAVDELGNPVTLDGIDFIKLQTAVNQQAGWLGEMSPEICGIVDVDANAAITGLMNCLVMEPVSKPLLIGETAQCHVWLFESGKPVTPSTFQYSSGNENIATISDAGIITALQSGTVPLFAKSGDNTLTDSIQISIVEPVGVNNIQNNFISLYPNPANDVITIETIEPILQAVLYNLNGQSLKILKKSVNTFDVSEIPSGFYVISIQCQSHWYTQKLLISGR